MNLEEIKERIKDKGIYGAWLSNDDIEFLIFQAEKFEVNKKVVEQIVGEETLWQEGLYESEMMKLQKEIERLQQELDTVTRAYEAYKSAK